MKPFPADFVAEMSRKAGVSPVWILKLSAGGSDYCISDQTLPIPPWSVTTLPWVAAWGQISEGLSGALNEIRISDFDLELLADPDANPNMTNLVTDYDLESAPASLYLWPAGTDNEPQEIGRYYVDDIELPDETSVRLILVDETSRLQNYVGDKVTLDVYPEADPDDVGKLIPIPFGSVKRLPVLAVDAGAMTSLPQGLNATDVAFDVSDAAGLSVGDVLQIDAEQVLIDALADDTLTVTRGHNTTIAATHQRGAIAWQVKSQFIYLASDVPVDSIDKIYGRVGEAEIDISNIATAYTGQSGDELAGYEGRAVIVLPGYVTVEQAIDLLVNDGISVEDSTALVDTIAIDNLLSVAETIGIADGISVTDDIDVLDPGHDHSGDTLIAYTPLQEAIVTVGATDQPSNLIDGSFESTDSLATTDTVRCSRVTSFSLGGTPLRYRGAVRHGGTGSHGYAVKYGLSSPSSYSAGSSLPKTAYTGWVSITSWDDLIGKTMYVAGGLAGYTTRIRECWLEVEYDTSPASAVADVSKSGSVSKSGTVSKTGSVDLGGDVTKIGTVSMAGSVTKAGTVTVSGNSTANTLVGDSILVNLTRAMAVTQCFDDLLARSSFGPVQLVGNLPADYVLNGAITEYRSVHYWLDTLAFQLRSWFRVSCGQPLLVVRPDGPTSSKSIPQPVTDSTARRIWSRKKASSDEIINRIQLLYDRDWTRDRTDGSYRGISAAQNAASITVHGERERPELWLMDFITDQAMAESVRDFYLARYATRRWIHEFKTYLDHAELEFADGVTLGWDGNKVGQITQVNHAPGDIETMDTVGFVVEV